MAFYHTNEANHSGNYAIVSLGGTFSEKQVSDEMELIGIVKESS